MSNMRKRQALYGRAPSADPNTIVTCTDPNSGVVTKFPAGSMINNGGNMKFGLYPTVGVSVGFLNLLSNCCDHNGGAGVNPSSSTCA